MGAVQTEPVYHVELVDGREIEKPVPKKWHILIQTYLILVLNRDLLSNEYQALPELNVLTGGRTADGRREYIIPDLVVAERSARYEDGDLADLDALEERLVERIGKFEIHLREYLDIGASTPSGSASGQQNRAATARERFSEERFSALQSWVT